MMRETYVRTILSRMSLEQKIGQCVVIGMSGTIVTNDLREAILRYHAGGVRLSPFTRIFRYFSDSKAKKQQIGADYVPSLQKIARAGAPPYFTPEEYAEQLNSLKRLAASRTPAIPLHMVIDQEGDTSKDMSRGGVVQFPSNLGLVAAKDMSLIYDVSKCIARQLKASGIDMIHSPVVDVNINPKNPEIGVRSFGDDPVFVAECAIAMMKGLQEEGIIATAKHFPGRGDSATDAHHSCPILDVDRKRLDAVELYPYRKLIEAGVDAIMVAHCVYPALDSEIATVSKKIITDLLRNELGFQGVVTTDSMTMGALIDKFGVGEACARALVAGADIVLMKAENHWRGEMFYTIKKWVEEGRLSEEELDAKVERILNLKYKYGLFDTMGIVPAEKAAEPYRDPWIIHTASRAARKAILIVKDELNALPLHTNRNILLINQLSTIKTPNDRFDHPALFSELMEEAIPTLQTYEMDFERNSEEENRLLAFVEQGNYDLILCTNYYDRAAKPPLYPKILIEKGYPVVLITNTPYFIDAVGGLIPDAKSIVLNMNLTPEGFRVCRDVLLGRIAPEGEWPLTTYHPFLGKEGK